MDIEFRVDVPNPEYIDTDEEASELLRLLMRKVELDKDDLIGFDTETYGKKLPVKSKPLDSLNDTVTFWSLSAAFDDSGEREYRRWCLQQKHFCYFSPLLENPLWNIGGWNLKYDGHISWNCDINIWNARWPIDGIPMARLHDENRRSHGLKQCAPDWVGLHMTSYNSLFDGVKDAQGKRAKEFETSLIELASLGHEHRVADYASYDAYAHLRTCEWLIQKLKDTEISDGYSLWDYYVTWEMRVTRMLWMMERRGMNLDLEYLKSQIPVIQGRIDQVSRDICRIAKKPLKLRSPKQLAEFFFTKEGLGLRPIKETGTGQASTDVEVMTSLAEAGVEVAGLILEHRSLDKIKSTYLDALITLAEYFDDHRIHPNFNQLGARTGRLSTNWPNSQNFPHPDNDEWGIRYAFIPKAGYKLLVADYNQVEMRIMADMSGDQKMLKAIRDGKDLHSFTVSIMTPDITYEEVVAAKKAEKPDEKQKWLKTQRQEKKKVGFGIIYGAGPPRISNEIEISEADWHKAINEMPDTTFERRVKRAMDRNPLLTKDKAVEQVGRYSVAGDKIQEYLNTFPGVKGFMTSTPTMCRHSMYFDDNNNNREWDFKHRGGSRIKLSESGHAKRFGYVQTLSGRLRRLEEIDHTNYFNKSEAERQSVNSRIQGSAYDITVAAMLAIESDPLCKVLGVQILNQVHDEIVMEVPEEHAEEAAPRVKWLMENPFGADTPPLSVPIPVDMQIVDRWSEAK